jgi:hypothetical protein
LIFFIFDFFAFSFCFIQNYYSIVGTVPTLEAWQKGDFSQERLDEISEMDIHAWLREQKAKEQNK